MDFKLKHLTSAVLLLLCMSCKAQKKDNQSYSQEEYVLAYKKTILYGCINEKTNLEFGKLMNEYNDTASREVAILFHAVRKEAKLLGAKYSKNIKPHTYYGDLKGKEFLFSDCVSYAFSKKVDSIAKESYKKQRE